MTAQYLSVKIAREDLCLIGQILLPKSNTALQKTQQLDPLPLQLHATAATIDQPRYCAKPSTSRTCLHLGLPHA
jgi:hypothetical protein